MLPEFKIYQPIQFGIFHWPNSPWHFSYINVRYIVCEPKQQNLISAKKVREVKCTAF